jgi:hypothetical protein
VKETVMVFLSFYGTREFIIVFATPVTGHIQRKKVIRKEKNIYRNKRTWTDRERNREIKE